MNDIDKQILMMAEENDCGFTDMLMELAAEALTIRRIITTPTKVIIKDYEDDFETQVPETKPTRKTGKRCPKINKAKAFGKCKKAMDEFKSLEKAATSLSISPATISRVLYINRKTVKIKLEDLLNRGAVLGIDDSVQIDFKGPEELFTDEVLDMFDKERWACISALRAITNTNNNSQGGNIMKEQGKNGITTEKAKLALEQCGGNKRRAAATFPVSIPTLNYWLDR